MRYGLLLIILLPLALNGFAQQNDVYNIPDSIKAIGFYTEVRLNSDPKKEMPGITANGASVHLGYYKKQSAVGFSVTGEKILLAASGRDVYPAKKSHAWNYQWNTNEIYPLLILTASDSATHRSLYSGYVFLPAEMRWKLIASAIVADTISLKTISPGSNLAGPDVNYSNRWLLRSGGTWKALDGQTGKPPVLRPLMRNIDSLHQQQMEEALLREKLKDSITYKEGMFYQLQKEGSGRFVNVSDTVVIHYKGWTFGGAVFDQTKEKPATFPLQRLIRGWQVGLTQSRIGGKIRLFIPSGSAYGIRTSSVLIPPNSILVFDIEVLDAKEKR